MKSFSRNKISQFKKALAITGLTLLAGPALAQSPSAPLFWSVQNGKLLDPQGNPFVFRGVTIDHTVAPDKTIQAIKDIAALGANSAQIEFAIKPVWVTGEFPREAILQLREIIKACKDNKLVCVLEANDVGGYSQSADSVSPSAIANYWGIADMRDALNGAQSHIIIGFSNQIFDGYFTSQEYRVRMDTYLRQLRDELPAGFIIMIDGNKWGQDTDNAMLQFAQYNLASNSYLNNNLIYSIDMFDAYTDPIKAHDYIAKFAQIGAPLVVGGFAPVPYYHPHNTAPRPTVVYDLPKESVMQYAEQYGAGYFGWSWSGNKNPALDLAANWNPSSLTTWGNVLFNGENGIKATAKPASHFTASSSSSSISSGSSSSVSSNTTNQPPVAMFEAYNTYSGSCTNGSIMAKATGSYDPEGDSLIYRWSLQYSGSATGYEVSFNSTSGVSYQLTLTVTDSHGAATSVTKKVSPIYIDCFSSSSSSVSSRSSVSSSSSVIFTSSSSIPPSSSSRSSVSSSRSSSSAMAVGNCSYVINSQWNNGFTAAVRIKNTSSQPINGWNVNWQYADGSKITNLWNASLSGSNPYAAKNLSWNSTIQPGQTIEFGFQGSKGAGAATIPTVTGSVCQ